MNTVDIWQIMTGAQVSTALVLIAAALVFIAIKLWKNRTAVPAPQNPSRTLSVREVYVLTSRRRVYGIDRQLSS